MAKILEELVLYDRFTNTFTSYIKQSQMAASSTQQVRQATQQMEQAQRAASTATGRLTDSIKGLVGGYVGLRGLRSLLNLSDTITSTTARLDMMNDGLQTTEELNNMIWESAQRSRGAYAETAAFVAKLGNLAGDAFSSNAEIVAFAEQINKQITLSGASSMEASAALLQLTQGLSSGALRGEELNSVLEQTPMIAKTIADYMGVTTGEMRELASEGKVTAEVVKSAMFAAAEETNAAFESMPMTWGQVWTSFQNVALQALQPVLSGINLLAGNMDTLAPILVGIGAGALAAAAGLGIQTAATWAANGAAAAFFATLLTNPLTYIALTIGLVVAAIYQWIQSVGGLEIAWMIAKNTVLTAWEELQYGAASVRAGVMSAFGDMTANVLMFIQNMVNGAIGAINFLIAQLNKIPGVSINALSTAQFGAEFALQNQAAQAGFQRELDAMRFNFDRNQAVRDLEIQLAQMENTSASSTSAAYSPYDEIAGTLGDISGSVKSIDRTVSMSDEDIKALVDVAERRYVNQVNLTSQTPVITVNGANTGRTAQDRRAIADAIQTILMEQLSSGSVRATARP